MHKSISFYLEITGTENTWQWKILHRNGNGNSSISGKLPFPSHIRPEEILSTLQSESLQNRTDYANFGSSLFKSIIPVELSVLISEAVCGDCLFEVPAVWASIPFELLFDNKGFLCDRFKIGTIIHLSSKKAILQPNAARPLSFGIIADPSGDLPHAYQEGLTIKKLLQSNGCSVRMISESEPAKIYETFSVASVIHFAGHSVFNLEDKKCGWKLKDEEIFNISEHITGNTGCSPLVVFSNSCEAARTSSALAGVAGAMMQSGVAQVIGPMTRVSDSEAQECAAVFFKEFLKSGQPAEALFAMKKSCSKNAASLVYRLFGDPCWVFPSVLTVPKGAPELLKNSPKKNKKQIVIAAVAILLFLLAIILFWPFPSGNGIMYMPGK